MTENAYEVLNQFLVGSRDLLEVIVEEKKIIRDVYINAFPEGSNPIFQTYPTYHCHTCYQFLERIGYTITKDGKSIFTLTKDSVDYPFNVVFEELGKYVESLIQKNEILPYLTDFGKLGSKSTVCKCETKGTTEVLNHFWFNVREHGYYYEKNLDRVRGDFRGRLTSLQNALQVSIETLDYVLELISDGLYRGEGYKERVELLKDVKSKIQDSEIPKITILDYVKTEASYVKSSAIWYLIDLIEKGETLEAAEQKYLQIVDPVNFRRVKSLAGEREKKKALEFIEENGLSDSLYRVHAKIEDIPEDLVVWEKPDDKLETNLEGILDTVPTKQTQKKFNGKPITIDEFLELTKTAKSIEVAKIDSRVAHISTAKFPDSKNIFKWGNHLGWSYTGGLTDSRLVQQINKSVADRGANIDAKFRISLAWYASDDLDLALKGPMSYVYFGARAGDGWVLDKDMNVRIGDTDYSPTDPIENTFANNPISGSYEIQVNNYTPRGEYVKEGFHLLFKIGDKVRVFEYPNRRVHSEAMIRFTVNDDKVTITYIHPMLTEINTNESPEFKEVGMIFNSPDDKHIFLQIKDKEVSGKERGFFVEFLTPEFREHRKVFEILGDRFSFDLDPNGVSAVGLSYNRDLDIPVRVDGRPYKIVKSKRGE